MKVVYLNPDSKILPIDKGVVLALGYFDGMHKAHTQLIKKAIYIAKSHGHKVGVVTFHPNPKYLLGRKPTHHLLTPSNKKISIVDKLGVDYLFIINFNELVAKISHEDFIKTFILPLNVTDIVTGFDYRYGYKGLGNIETLRKAGERTYKVHNIQEIKIDGKKISSTHIRENVVTGKVDKVHEMLGRFYSVEGIVIHGFKRGREMGYPTANLDILEEYLIPNTGVYAVKVKVLGKEYNGMCNIGYNPTFKLSCVKSVEVNIFDFNEDIYNEKLEVKWIKKIRNEIKFSSIEQLVDQLSKDKQQIRNFFKTFK